MPFPEDLKLRVKKKANFRCCLCQAIEVEIHHIHPQSEQGPDTEDNAAPRCGQCHKVYGGNPEKRTFIRQARDHWYEKCGGIPFLDADYMKELKYLSENTATKEDVNRAFDKLITVIHSLRNSPPSDSGMLRDLAVASNTALSTLSTTPYAGHLFPIHIFKSCSNCHVNWTTPNVQDMKECPGCRKPW